MVEYWAKAHDRLKREVTITKRTSAPVNFIVHSYHDMNRRLGRGRPFYIDVLKDGIAFYEAEGHEFTKPKAFSPAEVPKEAEGLRHAVVLDALVQRDDFADQGDHARGQRRQVKAAALHAPRRHNPNAVLQVELRLAHANDLALPTPAQPCSCAMVGAS